MKRINNSSIKCKIVQFLLNAYAPLQVRDQLYSEYKAPNDILLLRQADYSKRSSERTERGNVFRNTASCHVRRTSWSRSPHHIQRRRNARDAKLGRGLSSPMRQIIWNIRELVYKSVPKRAGKPLTEMLLKI